MSPEELKNLDREICRRWPKKFNGEELGRWRQSLVDWSMEEVVAGLNKFKDTSRFVPKIGEIIKLLPQRVGHEQVIHEPSFSDVTRRHMRIGKERSDAEVIMRYWRSVWWQYKSNADIRRASMDLAAKVAAERENVPELEIRSRKAFAQMIVLWDAQLKGTLTQSLNGCVCMLVNEGMPVTQARDYADWIEVSPDQFRGFLSDLRSEETVDVFA